jgi:hypothetical protein
MVKALCRSRGGVRVSHVSWGRFHGGASTPVDPHAWSRQGPPPQQGSGSEHQSGHFGADAAAGQCQLD